MPDFSQLHDALIKWFEANRQDLPWREKRDPYTVWLSEIMLQQTQVTTVVPYFKRFVERFPSVEALAEARPDDVLKLWEGLGYYSRARNLHRAAQMVVADYRGVFPAEVDQLMKLPGVGRYTAGAIASLAFGTDAPLVDGNVIRVFARLFDIDSDVRQPGAIQDFWERAERLLPAGRAGMWNEGLMELGRRICTPKNPGCVRCPLMSQCRAYAGGTQLLRPVKSPRKQLPHYDVTAGVISRSDDRILIAQRPLDGMLGGLWEFPGGKCEAGESLVACLRRELREELGIEVEIDEQITTIKHTYTHFRITLYVFACRYLEGEPQTLGCAAWNWIALDEMDAYAFPSTDRKIIAVLRDGSGQPAFDLSM